MFESIGRVSLEIVGIATVLLIILGCSLAFVYHNDPVGATRMVCSAVTSNAIDETGCVIRYWPTTSSNK